MVFLTRNIDSANESKFWLGIILSEKLEDYVNELADIFSVHLDLLAIIFINCVASMLLFYEK